MLYAEDFRRKAREAINGKWALAVGTGFIASLFGVYTALGTSGSGSSNTSSEELLESGMFSEEVIVVIAVVLAVVALIALALALVQFIVGGAVTLGYVKFNLDLVDGKDAQFSDLFSQFDRFGAGFVMQLLRSIFIFLWSLLLLIPGIIATYRYAMAPYILYENPNMSASEAIEASKQLMDGNKGRLFCLNLSFIGWDILCVFTLGIGYLWLKPYREAAYAAFYREIKNGKYSNQYTDYSTYNYYEANKDSF